MTATRTWSVIMLGIDGMIVDAAAHLGPDQPDAKYRVDNRTTSETMDRIRAAIRNSDLAWPNEPVAFTISRPASPAASPTSASSCDLALACAVLAATGQVSAQRLEHTVLLGKLALDGRVRPVRGVLPALHAAHRAGLTRAVVPNSALPEAALVPGIQVLGAERLSDVVAWLRGEDHRLAPRPCS